METQLKHPFAAMVAGSSQCGKTTFVKRMILHLDTMVSPTPQAVVWHYAAYQTAYDSLASRVVFKKGVPLADDIWRYSNILLVLEDLMLDMSTMSSDLFTKHVHHQNLSVLYIVQNIFNKAKNHRTLSSNTNYIVLFKNLQDRAQVSHLA